MVAKVLPGWIFCQPPSPERGAHLKVADCVLAAIEASRDSRVPLPHLHQIKESALLRYRARTSYESPDL